MGTNFWTVWAVATPLVLLLSLVAVAVLGLILMRRWMQDLAAVVMALRPSGQQPGPAASFSLVKELPPASPEAALEFFKGAHQSHWWPYLAHRFQYATRGFLESARVEGGQGHDAAAMFYAGAAWYASREAVMPQREIDTCLAVLQAKEAERKIEEMRDRGGKSFRQRHVH